MEAVGGLRPESLQHTPDKLVEILGSEKFIQALSVAATETRQSGHETGFFALIDQNGNLRIAEVTRGGTDSMGRFAEPQVLMKIDKEDGFDWEHSKDMLSFHFHPEATGHIEPSGSDLYTVFPDRIPYMGIGKVQHGGNITVLLVRASVFKPLKEELDEYESRGFYNQRQVQDALKESGFTSLIINYCLQEGNYILTERSKRALQSWILR